MKKDKKTGINLERPIKIKKDGSNYIDEREELEKIGLEDTYYWS